ncbi:MAG: hypothetical protein ACI9KE_001628 [Polyangiales bacterium]|jgi:hypothetical protein
MNSIRRQLALVDFALGALRRRMSRSVALTAAIALVTFLYGSGFLLTDALRAEVEGAALATPDLTLQRLVAGRPGLIDASSAETLRQDPGVRSIEARVWGFLYVPALEANIVVVGDDDLRRERGAPRTGEITPEPPAPAIVGSGLAERLALHAGDRLAIPGASGPLRFEIIEVRSTASAIHDADAMIVDVATARALLGVAEGQAVDVAIELVRPEEAAVVGARLGELIEGARVIDRRSMTRAYELTLEGRGGLMNALFLPCLACLLLLGWERLSGLGGDEVREIAILKSVGWLTSDVLYARLYESAVLALLGTFAGCIFAYVYVFWLHAPGLAGILFGWSVLHAELDLTPQSDIVSMISLVSIVVVPFIVVGLLPAWRAASKTRDGARR